MDQNREIELKLEIDPGGAGSAVDRLGLGEGERTRLVAVYYDTPDEGLRDRGISFRVRRAGDAYVQTIKMARGRAAGLFDRAEWERKLNGQAPDLAAIDEAGLRDVLAVPGAWDAVRPMFTVEVERTAWRVPLPDGSAEIVLDRGRVLADGREDAVCELELELKAGDPGALFGLARQVAESASARIGVLTKAERGYRLLEGRTDQVAKAEPLRLAPDATTAEAFAAIVQACLRHFRLNEAAAVRREAAGLHQSRVALRRLRSALSLFRDVVSDDRLPIIREQLRRLAAVLGEARNLDVLLDRMDPGKGGRTMRARLGDQREAAYDRALAELESAATRSLIIDILEWSEIGAWRTAPPPKTAPRLAAPARAFAADALDRYRRRLKKHGAGLAAQDPERRHRVRIEAKKLRYAAEFFASLFDDKKARRRHKPFLAALEDLQSLLGALNDIETGESIVRDLSGKRAALPTRAEEPRLLRDAEDAHDRFVDARPFWR